MLDSLFGIKHFRNEIVWKRHPSQSNDAKRKFYAAHDVIYFYAKTDNYYFEQLYKPLDPKYVQSQYKYVDENGRRYRLGPKRKLRKGIENRQTRHYLDTNKGKTLTTLWTEVGLQLASGNKERLGFLTQKPLAIYERIVKASSPEGGLVLDPFCGSGTTLEAAKRLGRDYIGIDVNPDAIVICEKRLNPS